LRELVKCCPQTLTGTGTNDLWLAGRVLKAKNPFPLNALVEAEIRDSSRAGSQAPNAPPSVNLRPSW